MKVKRLLLMILAMTVGSASAQDENASDAKKEPKPVIEKVEGDIYKIGVIQFNRKTREIQFPAVVNQDEVVLEFAIVNDKNGKLHESLLSTAARPFDLQVVMKLLKYVASERDLYPLYNEEGEVAGPMKVDDKGQVTITVEYDEPVMGWAAMIEKETARKAAIEKATDEGKEAPATEAPKYEMTKKSVDIGEMIANVEADKPLDKEAWIYTGSIIRDGEFMAEVEGAIAAVYRAEDTMINAFAKGSDRDEIWFPRKGHVPPIGAAVTVKITPRAK